jgi:hypothetical protein
MALLSFATVTTLAAKTTFIFSFNRFEIFFGGEKSTQESAYERSSEEAFSQALFASAPPGGETLMVLDFSVPWDDEVSPRISFISLLRTRWKFVQ